MRRGLALAAAATAWLAIAPNAGSQPPRKIAIIGLSAEGVSPDVRQQIETLIEEGLRRTGQQVTTRKTALDVMTARELPEGCTFGPCVASIAGALGVDRLLDAHVSAEGQSYNFVLSIVEGRTGTPVAQVVGSCPVCTVAEALDKVNTSIDVLEGRSRAASGVAMVPERPPPRPRSRVPAVVLAAAGAVSAGGGALLVTQTSHDDAGWAAIGAGATAFLTGLIWSLVD